MKYHFGPPKVGKKQDKTDSKLSYNIDDNTSEDSAKMLNDYEQLFEKMDYSVVPLFSNRTKLPPHKDFIIKAKNEICLLAIHGTNFIRLNEDLIKDKLSSGCKIRILLMSMYNISNGGMNENIKYFQDISYHPSILEDLQASKKYTTNWIANLNQDLKPNIMIRYYFIFPSALYLLVDKEYDTGFVLITPTLPYLKSNDRPVFSVNCRSEKDLFKRISKSFDDIWNNSKKQEDI